MTSYVRSACGITYPLFEGATFIVLKGDLNPYLTGSIFTYKYLKEGCWYGDNPYINLVTYFLNTVVAPYNEKEISLEELL